jgi:hypothetical protein
MREGDAGKRGLEVRKWTQDKNLGLEEIRVWNETDIV